MAANDDSEREALIWRLIKAQGGKVSLDMTQPPEGFVVLSEPSHSNALHRIFVAEVLAPDGNSSDQK